MPRFPAPAPVEVTDRRSLQVEMRFGEIVDDLCIQSGQVTGALVRNLSTGASEAVSADCVVLGVGHSARDVYEMLEGHDVHMAQKDFAVRACVFLAIMSSDALALLIECTCR